MQSGRTDELDWLTRDEHGGMFRSRRGDPQKNRTERLSSGERKIHCSIGSVGAEAEEVVRLKRAVSQKSDRTVRPYHVFTSAAR